MKEYDVVIVGAGPAGITAAIYLKRANLNCLIIEKNAPGGQILNTSTIENYPGFVQISGPDLAMKFYEQITNLEIPYQYGEVKEIIDEKDYKIIKTEKEEFKAKAIILALGKKPKSLKQGNSEKLIGKGISFCALCDGSLYKNQDVAIIGGGNSALEESLYLADLCSKVTIIYRGDDLRGDEILVDRIKEKDNIDIIYNSEIKEFNEKEGILDSLDIDKDGKNVNLKVKACFIFIGYEPATNFLKDLEIIDKLGYIEVNEKMETKIKGIYACGDAVKKEAYQIVTATADGANAAIACLKKLS